MPWFISMLMFWGNWYQLIAPYNYNLNISLRNNNFEKNVNWQICSKDKTSTSLSISRSMVGSVMNTIIELCFLLITTQGDSCNYLKSIEKIMVIVINKLLSPNLIVVLCIIFSGILMLDKSVVLGIQKCIH